jgi:Protein of unknown function (DUF1573)
MPLPATLKYAKYGSLFAAAVVLCVGASFSGIFVAQAMRKLQTQVPATEPPTLVIADAELDFGQLYESQSHDHPFHITNASDRAVTIVHFTKSCDCVEITAPTDLTLQPGETKPFRAMLSPVSRSGSMSGESISLGISAKYEAEGQPDKEQSWQLRGTVLPTIRFKPAAGSTHQTPPELLVTGLIRASVQRLEFPP